MDWGGGALNLQSVLIAGEQALDQNSCDGRMRYHEG